HDPECIADIIDLIKPKLFYLARNGEFCEEILKLWNDDPAKVDLVNLVHIFEKGEITLSRLHEVISSIPTAKNVRYYVERLRDIAALREAVKVGQELISASSERDPEEIKTVITTAEGKLSKITESTIATDTTSTLKD